jgi:RNA polymerase sigma-70 factor (ECF subfamily)
MQRLPFETTHWSLIMAAGGADSAAARVAIARLCEKYWYPLYAYARRQGLDPDDARDLTQGFLTSLLERRDIENVRQERGRFRSFLLASLKHFIANEAARGLTQKRGGGEVILSLEICANLFSV